MVAPLPVLQQGHGQLTKQIKDCLSVTTRVVGRGLCHTLKDADDTLTFGSVSWGYQDQEVGDVAVPRVPTLAVVGGWTGENGRKGGPGSNPALWSACSIFRTWSGPPKSETGPGNKALLAAGPASRKGKTGREEENTQSRNGIV